jgi:hypothetical protein
MVALLHEGKTDRTFFDNILKAYNLSNDEENIKYYDFGGVDNIFKLNHRHYDILEEEIGVGKISKVLIVVDADNKYDDRENNLKNLIEDLEFDIEIDYFIMCGENHTGNLESFLISSLDDEQKECLKTFLDCYEHNFTDKHIYNIFYKDKKHPFDFNTPAFDNLKSKLEKLLRE